MNRDVKSEGFVCTNCGKYGRGTIVDTRITAYGRRRRRVCEYCHQKYSTIEISVTTRTHKMVDAIEISVKSRNHKLIDGGISK